MDRNGAREAAAAIPGKVVSLDSHRSRTAFERVHAAQLATRIPANGPRVAADSWVRANRAAFLILEDERRAVAARLQRSDRRSERYRDLILITKLSRLEHAHLVGRIGRRVEFSSVPDEPLALGGNAPADWAEPWARGPLLELRATYVHYRQLRDRLRRRLLATTRESAAADAERRLARVVARFEALSGEWRVEVGGPRQRVEEARPRASLRFNMAAAVAAFAVAVAGIGALVAQIHSGAPSDSAITPSTVASAAPRPLPTLRHEARDRQSAGARDAGKRDHHMTKPSKPQSDAGEAPPAAGDQTELTASETPLAPAPAPAAPAPVATSASQPPPAPSPDPQPSPNPGPGPISSLPPPTSSLPPPGGGGGGG
jgi:hypothetical protein